MRTNTIAEQLFFTTVRIDTPIASGTGFVFAHNVGSNLCPILVTNKHVVAGSISGCLTFIKRNGDQPVLGDGFRLEIGRDEWQKLWFGHPDENVDIAISFLNPLVEFIKRNHEIDLYFRCIGTDIIPSEEQLEELDAIEPVTFIGYPNGLWDEKNLLPIARRGTTASPIQVDFNGSPCFLIDASVFGGSSGSPVFVMSQGSFSNKNGGLVIGSRFYFVGVIAAVFSQNNLNEIIEVPMPTKTRPMARGQEMIDLGIVFKARTVIETVEALLEANGIETKHLDPALAQTNFKAA